MTTFRRILLDEVRGRWRRRERSVPVAEFAEEPAVADPSDEVIRRDGLRQALLTLPLRQRTTVVLRYLEGLSERETAAVLGCSTGTVKSQSSRAPAALLRDGLRRAVDGETFRTDPDAVLRRARRTRRRTLVTRGAAGTGALAVAATLFAVQTGGVPEVRDAACVVERASAATPVRATAADAGFSRRAGCPSAGRGRRRCRRRTRRPRGVRRHRPG